MEPALRTFIVELGQRVQALAGRDPDLGTFREASRRARLDWASGGDPVASGPVDDLGLPARRYVPPGGGSKGLLVYLHGGGWTILDIDSYDRVMRRYAAATGWTVLALDYPLSPESRFPAALVGIREALGRIRARASSLGGGPDRIVLGGDSSGANLALAVALDEAAERGGPRLGGLLLNYGVYDHDLDRPSYAAFSDPPFLLTRTRMDYFWTQYCAATADRADPRASPLRADRAHLAALPPTAMVVAALDVLVDENLALHGLLRDLDVDVRLSYHEDAVHAFLEAVGASQEAARAIDFTRDWLAALQPAPA